MVRWVAVAIGLVVATVAQGESVTTKVARGQLFSPKGSSVEVFPTDFLGEAEAKAVKGYAAQFEYYAAFAVSPGDPADSGSAVGLANFHSEAAARTAALGACNARRQTGRPCIVVAVTRPKGWKPRNIQLSAEATAAFRKEYRKARAPKAMAISPSSGAWAIGRGDGSRALATCNDRAAKRGRQDCQIAIADR
ncbi:5-aminolevulic acid synthase [Actibacterium sp. 188UL27-1]|uniref:5-aminolevulic acid synthase n=1 Tax=Actibacterium sp. 188UL27-1 TaxID=2786961 RepID=UPI001956054A|nr:5-aminolevulic acid synthase [Actibacterium sp. 188UL27-1]MBM7067501.1 5-aminolevulic acid synthase [Actibacterium sp. 188UL27-1]